MDRGYEVTRSLVKDNIKLSHLGLTKNGHPKHPLYLKGDLEPMRMILIRNVCVGCGHESRHCTCGLSQPELKERIFE